MYGSNAQYVHCTRYYVKLQIEHEYLQKGFGCLCKFENVGFECLCTLLNSAIVPKMQNAY